MKTIERDNFHTRPMKYDVNIFVNFIYNFIDYTELINSPHATEWTNISVKKDGSKEQQEQHIKSQMYNIVEKIITKQYYDKKIDNTFSSFIKRIICNVIGDVCGGFKVTDLREENKEQVDAMQYIRENKHSDMRKYISKQLTKNPKGGFVVCLENDHGCVFSGSGVKQSTMKNIVYKNESGDYTRNDVDSICYLQLGHSKGNQAKGIYYTGNYSVTEVDFEDVLQRMVNCGYNKHIIPIKKYKDRFSVCCVYNTKETDNDDYKDSFWFKKKYFIILHNKSVGTKNDIKKNTEEYACMRKLIDTYAIYNEGKGITKVNGAYTEYVFAKTEKEDVLVLGDFNLPLWGKDNGYLNLTIEDQKTYPVQEVYQGDYDTFMTKNLELYSTWNNRDVAFKDRLADWMQNSQAGIGKRTIPGDGPRNYNTDMVFGNIKLNDSWGPTIIDSRLYPDPWLYDYTKMTLPMVSDDFTWFSDHQSMEMTMTDNRGENEAFSLVVLNTLSDCCSGQQHIKKSFDKKNIERVREEFATLLVEYINKCVVFDNNIIEDIQKVFNKDEEDEEDKEDEDVEEEEEEIEVKELTIRDVMSEREYNVIKSLVTIIVLNYVLWIIMAIINMLFN